MHKHKELTQVQIDRIVTSLQRKGLIRNDSTKSHPWITVSGMYEDPVNLTRLFIWNSFAYLIVSKIWIDDPIRSKDLPPSLRYPWGTYQPLPPKPPK